VFIVSYTLKKALDDGGVWIFDVRVDYSENMKLTRKLSKEVCNSNKGS